MNVEARLVESDVDEESEVSSDDQSSTFEVRRSKCRNVFSFLTVEPIVALVSLAFGIQYVIGQDLLIFKSCHVNLKYDLDVCSNLSAHQTEQVEVQKLSATITMYQNILTAIPSIIVSLFLGPWSDYHGRKPLLIAPIVGFCFAQVVYIGCYFFVSLNAEFLLLSSISNMFGGFTCLLIGVYGFIADTSKLRSRTSRVAFVDLFLFLSYPFGIFLSDHIYKAGGFYFVFGLGFGLNCVALLYAIFGLKETHDREVVEATEARVRLYDFQNVVSVFKTVFKRREGGLRAALLLLLLAMMLNMSANYDSGTTYLYTRLKFSWTEEEYTLFSSSTSVVRALSTFGCMPILSLKLQLHDALIGLIGAVLAIAGYLVYAFSYASWMLYLGAGISVLSSTPAIVIRSMLTKVVPKTELGKVFSLLSSLESAVPLIISPLIVNIYKSTIDHFAGTIFVVFSSISLLVTVDLIAVYVILKRSSVGYDRLHNNVESSQEEDSSTVAT